MRPRPRSACRLSALRALRAADEAVSEVLGYILMFFLSSAVLVLSLQAFTQSRADTADLQVANELRLVSDRVANEVLEAGLVSNQFPNSTYEITLRLPALPGYPFYVQASTSEIWANTTDGRMTADAQAFQVQAAGLTLGGTVYNSQGYVNILFSGSSKTINLTV